MKVLVTGGTGVVGRPAVRRLLQAGHEVRLLSRHADSDARQFVGPVSPVVGGVERRGDVEGAAEGCDAILHIAGVVSETPEATFQLVNVEGTRHIVEEAERAGVRRLVHISSLGADRGSSPYHQSKIQAEDVVRSFSGDWLILRPGNVYGPGDEVVSLLIQMIRSMPAVPVVDGGDLAGDPIWAEDFAEAIVQALEREDLSRRTLELTGGETVTMNGMVDRLSRLLGKDPVRVPLPGWLADAGASILSKAGFDLPFGPDQVKMLLEGSTLSAGTPNALVTVFSVVPTPLDEGLRMLVESMPEQLPDEGVGRMMQRTFKAHVEGPQLWPEELFRRFRQNFAALWQDTPVSPNAEPRLEGFSLGSTLTLNVQGRGNVQVRVVEMTDTSATCVTVQGHPLSGAVRFSTMEGASGATVFKVETWDRPATVPDAAAMIALGRSVQADTWRKVIARLADYAGGRVYGDVVQEDIELTDTEAARIESWIEELVMQRRREEQASAGDGPYLGS